MQLRAHLGIVPLSEVSPVSNIQCTCVFVECVCCVCVCFIEIEIEEGKEGGLLEVFEACDEKSESFESSN